MRIRFPGVAAACCVGAFACAAQTAPTAQSVEAQLKGPFLMLRGMYDGCKLAFDTQGNLIGTADVLPFSLSALRVNRVKVTDSNVEIDAMREGLIFSYGRAAGISAKPWERHNTVEVDIAREPQHPEVLNAVLRKVFSVGFNEALVDEVPDYWRPWLRHELDQTTKLEPPSVPGVSRLGSPEMPSGAAKLEPPTILHSADPLFTQAAKKAHYQGIEIVGLIVDTSGQPRMFISSDRWAWDLTSRRWKLQGISASAPRSSTENRFLCGSILN
ncbi:MAG TPA: hypothetical protein VME18_01565 [Acidobacteriaceae bacterium]|nr:hypothetical protein [Acidobacteriaceae bacterium]